MKHKKRQTPDIQAKLQNLKFYENDKRLKKTNVKKKKM